MTTPDRDGPPGSVLGVVLCGGSSTRMGVDKAWIGWPEDPFASRVARALLDSGCDDVVLVGGDRGRAEQAGWRWLPDAEPGAGPLAGLLSAAPRSGRDRSARVALVVCACDLPRVTGPDLRPLVGAVAPDRLAAPAGPVAPGGEPAPPPDVVVFTVDDRPQWSAVALSRAAVDVAADAYAEGVRSLWSAFTDDALRVTHLEPRDEVALRDVDRPEDLPSAPSVRGRPGAVDRLLHGDDVDRY